MSLLRLVALICALLLCAGCGGRPGIKRLDDDSVVLAFGDSLTRGSGASQAESYPAVLAGLLDCRVINAGVRGEETHAGLSRLPSMLEQTRPDLVILCHGGNDLLRRRPLDTIRENLRAMIIMVQESGADAVLVGVPGLSLRLQPPRFYEELAQKHAIPYDSKSLSRILSTPALKSDQAHPNAAGYRRLAESLAALIQASQME